MNRALQYDKFREGYSRQVPHFWDKAHHDAMSEALATLKPSRRENVDLGVLGGELRLDLDEAVRRNFSWISL